MPQKSGLSSADFAPLSQFLTGTDPWTKGAADRRRIDLEEERNRQRALTEQEAANARQQQIDIQTRTQNEQLRHNQEVEQRANQDLLLKQQADMRAVQDQDFQEWQRSNPAQPPLAPAAPKPPTYQTDPMTNYDEPKELTDFDTFIQGQLGSQVHDPQTGAAIDPTTVPVDAVSQVRQRAIQYIQAGLDPATAASRASSELFGAAPTYAPGKPAVEGSSSWNPLSWIGAGTDPQPAVPAKLTAAPGTAPPSPVDLSKGPKAMNEAARLDYETRQKAYEREDQARLNYKAPIYPGYPWRDRRAAGDPNATTPAPVPPVPGTVPPAPAQATPKRMKTKGGNVLEFD